MAEKIKILFIHHGTGIGGAPISLLNLVKNLPGNRFECKVAFVKGGEIVEIFKQHGIKTDVIDTSTCWFAHSQTEKIQLRYFYRYLGIYRHWRNAAYKVAPDYLSRQDADIVHLNSHALTSWAFAAKKAGKIVVLHNREATSRGYFGLRYRILKRLITENCDHIINISEDNKKRLGIKRNSSVVYNFVDIPHGYRPSMQGCNRQPRVLFLGGMASIKGFETVVACLPYLDDNITLQFAGHIHKLVDEQGAMGRLKRWVKRYSFRKTYQLEKIQRSPNAKILGVLRDPLPVIDGADILITPFKIEHFARPAIEAFAYGKPVIGTDVEGMDEIIDHGINGLIVEKSNPRALADAINQLCRNPEKARQIGQKGRNKAVRLFSPEVNVRKVVDIYEALMGANQR